jgi:hypothetical protein
MLIVNLSIKVYAAMLAEKIYLKLTKTMNLHVKKKM